METAHGSLSTSLLNPSIHLLSRFLQPVASAFRLLLAVTGVLLALEVMAGHLQAMPSAGSPPFDKFVDPSPSPSNGFGTHVVPLSTGNVVITSPSDDAGGLNAGAVYLFDGATGDLISTLRGSSPSDRVGSDGVTALSNGNYVVISPRWANGAVVGAGAVTWGDGTTGIAGVVDSSNSLVGSRTGDQVGREGVTVLSNGNYVVSSPIWDNSAGAVTWCDGATGFTGVVDSSNSLVGSSASDQVGSDGVTALSNGNYVVSSSIWDNGAFVNAGAVTWGDGTTGIAGVVDSSNSLVGSSASDQVGRGVTALSNGNYVVSSPIWDNGADANAGAVTWGDGTTGIAGVVSSSNSLVGSSAHDNIGIGGVTALSNGNYVVSSPNWDNGAVGNAGAATWGDGTTGMTGVVDSSNSLVGSSASDGVGSDGVTALSNGNYVVSSSGWDNGAVVNAGAATWGDGTTGMTGVVDSSNSLVGSSAFDFVGSDGVTALSNGNYVVSSSSWKNGAVVNAGAVTWGDGTTGIAGVVDSSNSLVGSSASDQVGRGGVTALSNGNYVVSSHRAVTWGDGTTGMAGVVSSSNSLVGSSAFDFVGTGGVTALSNGNYVVSSPEWDNGAVVNAGAATWGDGTTGMTGVVDSNNSLVGSSAGDQVGIGGVTALSNGNYVVSSSGWDNGAVVNAGAVTWGDGTTGIAGVVDSSNSLVGSSASDNVGSGGVTALSNGNYVVSSSSWDNGAVVNAGAATWGHGATGITGVVDSNNSLVGLASGTNLELVVEDDINQTFIASFLNEGEVRVGSVNSATADTYVDAEGDFAITVDQGTVGLDAGDTVTWKPGASDAVPGLVFGTNAFSSVQAAIDATDEGGTVHIAAGLYDEGAEITIAKDLTLIGDGPDVTELTGNSDGDDTLELGEHRVLSIDADDHDVTLTQFAIINGKTAETGSTFEDVSGAGLLILSTGSITIDHLRFEGNKNASGRGPARFGGAIYNGSGTLTVSTSTFSDNSSQFGGGIYNHFGILTVSSSTFSGNSAQIDGGGIYNNSSTLTVSNATFSGNSAPEGHGGGIFTNRRITVSSSTFSGNSAQLFGGGIHDFNSIGLALNNTLIVGNSAPEIQGSLTDNGGNLIGIPLGRTIDDILAPLADNGGPTQTHALVPGSPAIDMGVDNGSLPDFDQRGPGFARIFGAQVDIGAYEFVDTVAPSVTINQATTQADPSNISPVVFEVVFSEPVTGFDETDVVLGGTATTGVVTVSGEGALYTVRVTATGDGTIIANVPAGAVVDTSLNPSLASTRGTVTYDATPPVLTLIGDATLTIPFGSVFEDPGATAIDALEGDLTSDIIVTGDTVNTSQAGMYTLRYHVSDRAQNAAAEITRVVTVGAEPLPEITVTGMGETLTSGDTSPAITDGTDFGSVSLGASRTHRFALGNAGDGLLDLSSAMITGTHASEFTISGIDDATTVRPPNIETIPDTEGFNVPVGLAEDSQGNLYVAEFNGNRVLKIDADTGAVTTVAGTGALGSAGDDGPATAATLNRPIGVAIDANDHLFIAERNGHRIRRVDAGTGTISTVAGTGTAGNDGDGGPATAATLNLPNGIVFDAAGDLLIASNGPLRKLDMASETMQLVADLGGAEATDVAVGPMGEIYVTTKVQILRVDPTGLTLVLDDLSNAFNLTVDPVLGDVLISEASKHRVLRLKVSTGEVETLIGDETAASTGDGGLPSDAQVNFPRGLLITADGDLIVAEQLGGRLRRAALPQDFAITFTPSDLGLREATVEIASNDINNATFTFVIQGTGDALPTVTINQAASQSDPTNSDTIHFTATFSEEVTGFDGTGVMVSGTALPTTAVVTGSGDTYNVAVSGMSQDGEVTATVLADVAIDAIGGGSEASTSTDHRVTYDTTLPVITLVDGDLTQECGTDFVDPGATATDAVDGDLSSEVTINATQVNVDVPNDYIVTFSVADRAGNLAETTRTVTVQDTTKPVITLIGGNPQILECPASYSELGAMAVDTCDGNLTSSIVIEASSVNPNELGNYLVSYNVTDQAGNVADEVTRTVMVQDTTPPVLTLNGDASMTIPFGSFYQDLGATAADACEGNLTSDIIVTGDTVDTSQPGMYTLRFHVSDSAQNAAAEITRVVTVGAEPLPEITVTGMGETLTSGDTSPAITDGTDFGSVSLGASRTHRFALGNAGDGLLDLSSAMITGTHASEFTISGIDDATTVRPPNIETIPDTEGFNVPVGLAEDSQGNLYVAEFNGNRVLKIDADTGAVTTVAGTGASGSAGDGGLAMAATLNKPIGVAVDANDHLFIAERDGHRIRRVDAGTGTISTVAGTGTSGNDGDGGPATAATLNLPNGIVFDAAGDLLIASLGPLRKLAMTNGTMQLVADLGGAEATDVAVGPMGEIYVTTKVRILRVDPTGLTLVLDDLSNAFNITVEPVFGDVLLSDAGKHQVLRLNVRTGEVETLIGDEAAASTGDGGLPSDAQVNFPRGLLITADGDLIVAEQLGGRLRRATLPQDFAITFTPSALGLREASVTIASNDPTAPNFTFAIQGTGDALPTVTINQAASQSDPTNSDTIHFTATFSEEVTGFDGTGVTVGGTAQPTTAVVTGSGDTYNVAVSGMSQDGIVTATVLAAAAMDAIGGGNMASTSDDSTVTYDTTPPVVTLIGGTHLTHECGTDFVDPGAMTDDGSLVVTSGDVLAMREDYQLNYNATDAAGNEAVEVTRIVTVQDTTAPVITLVGSATVEIPVGQVYTDPGATVFDACEGDLEVMIDATTVDTAVPGPYMVTFNVTDSSGNMAEEVTRTVTVLDAVRPWRDEHFTPEELADPSKEATLWGFAADPDGDCRPNGFELLHGSDPLVFDAVPALTQGRAGSGASSAATVSFPKRQTLAGVTLEVLFSASPQTAFAATSVPPTTTSLGDAFDQATYTDDVAVAAGASRYAKVVLSHEGTTISSETFGTACLVVKPHTLATQGTLTFLGMPFIQAKVTAGTVTASASMRLTDAAAAWPVDALVGHFVIVTSGTHAGLQSDIVSNTETSLTLSDDLSVFGLVGASFEVRPHTRVGQLFGPTNAAGLLGGENAMAADNVLLIAPGGAETQLFYSTLDTHWLDGNFENATNRPLMPEQGFIVRRKTAQALNLYPQGVVRRQVLTLPIEQGYNLISTITTAGATLDNLGLNTGDPTTGLAAGQNPSVADNVFIINPDGSTSLYWIFEAMNSWVDVSYQAAGQTPILPGSAFYIQRKAGRAAFNLRLPVN